jgi:crotonobetainyl-CoA:carnitine CoA-transferase CaiB-like acyl-CoA transferase
MSILSGHRVLDCTHAIAGPYCSMLLADMGADVIKIESLQGDVSRTRLGAYRGYDFVNRGKRTLALDLRSPEGAAIVAELAKSADVLVENYRPGALDQAGLGYERLRSLNPQLVYCSVSGFGGQEPGRELAGLDLIAQAMSGVMSFTGIPDGPPVVAGVPFADIGSGVFAALGVVAALLERHASGQGQHVEATLFDTALAFATFELGPYFRGGSIAQPWGSGRKYLVPYGAFATADEHIVIAVNTPATWQRLLEVLDEPALSTDGRFQTLSGRVEHRGVVETLITERLATRPAADWLAALARAGIPASRINNVAGAAASPIAAARGMFPEIDGEPFIAAPMGFSRTPTRAAGGPRELGEDGRAILSEAGFDSDRIDRLVAQGIVARG